jgi:hypothetical protein
MSGNPGELLEQEKERIARLIATVESTLQKLKSGVVASARHV